MRTLAIIPLLAALAYLPAASVFSSQARASLLAPAPGSLVGAAQAARASDGPAAPLQRKIDYLIANGEKPRPDPRPTVLTDAEVDAYMNSGRLKIPAGISDIHLVTAVGEATATAKIDFDKLLARERRANPLWTLFSGIHDVKVLSRVWGKDGMGNVQVMKVWFDGREVPRFALEFFLEHYLKPRVPQASLDSRFKMPARIWTATVTRGKTTLVQK